MSNTPQLPNPCPEPNPNNPNDPNNWKGPESEAAFMSGLLGARWFKVNSNNEVTGVFHEDPPYNNGINNAVCNARRQNPLPLLTSQQSINQAKASMDHKIAGQDCRCGFYAYFKEQNIMLPLPTMDNADTDSVMGIIEGWGTVTLGPLGFRASHCKIVALVAPTMEIAAQYRNSAVFPTLADACHEFPLTEV
jgi:hypothetical protein